MDEQRIDELEIKVAYQDDTINQLNDVIIRQQKDIDRLKMICDGLTDKVSGLSEAMVSKPEDDIPPHY